MNINHAQGIPPSVIHRPVVNQQLVKQASTTLPAPEKVHQVAAQQGVKESPHQNKTEHKPTWQFDSRFEAKSQPNRDVENLVPKTTGSLDLLHQQAQEAYKLVANEEHKLIVDKLI